MLNIDDKDRDSLAFMVRNNMPTHALRHLARLLGLSKFENACHRLIMICAVNGRGDEPTLTSDPSDKEAYQSIRDMMFQQIKEQHGEETFMRIADMLNPPDRPRYPRTRTLPKGSSFQDRLSECPSIHRTGSVTGMKEKYWGKNALCVRCGDYIYNVTQYPEIYAMAE